MTRPTCPIGWLLLQAQALQRHEVDAALVHTRRDKKHGLVSSDGSQRTAGSNMNSSDTLFLTFWSVLLLTRWGIFVTSTLPAPKRLGDKETRNWPSTVLLFFLQIHIKSLFTNADI
ncbi:uncharacterized protein LY79DRAFT_66257 [Colletotrichum navitas]|uniref:Uncharacterized protein n=1 Tax=Colletotrichum navitas TaxID=681940 RepID=A0AAD8PM86_9PEZI|nr:uncharacterized protein LY79DRAFT_66257 [Colletotrichum navitas]KAK1569832.1 hypothetical protein LY79DRAFT_66257 [Colletotrichum navitas]